MSSNEVNESCATCLVSGCSGKSKMFSIVYLAIFRSVLCCNYCVTLKYISVAYEQELRYSKQTSILRRVFIVVIELWLVAPSRVKLFYLNY